MPSNAAALSESVAASARSAGSNRCVVASAAAMFIAVGKTSFDDWPRLTSSFGCTSRPSPRGPPSSSEARLASTSFTFMLVCVPEPVCQTASGNSAAWRPASASSAAAAIASAISCASTPSLALTCAAARLTISSARINSGAILSLEIRKWWSERWVCAPHSRSAGTSIVPNASRSRRVPLSAIIELPRLRFVGPVHQPSAHRARQEERAPAGAPSPPR